MKHGLFVLLFCILYSSSFITLGNAGNLTPHDHCVVREFVTEFAFYLQPYGSSTNQDATTADWIENAFSALQLGALCNFSEPKRDERVSAASPYRYLGEQATAKAAASCDQEIFVDPVNGSDTNPGTISKPLLTIQKALKFSRSQREMSRKPNAYCITLRAGTFYLGKDLPRNIPSKHDSRLGALQLTAADSGLTIRAYESENVVLSGGYEFKPNWNVYKNTTNGVVYATPIPEDMLVDAHHFNELYIDDVRAIRARWPNADPSITGLYTNPTGYINSASAWLPAATSPPAVEIQVAQPVQIGYFPQFQVGIAGPASVYDPPFSFWATSSPPEGSTFRVSSGLVYNAADLPRADDWTRVDQGFVHTFPNTFWANWIFEIAAVNKTNNTILFGKGGYQEARGAGGGSDYYVENIFEELDSAREWYLDRETRMLYFQPNSSSPVPPKSVVAGQLACILSIHGNQPSPADSITISGVTFAHTANTFMRPHEVPSGGDWAVHRGGSVFLQGTQFVTITNSLFTNLGGNAVLVSNWNRNATIRYNEFVWLGDSAILLIGRTAGINGVGSLEQPTDTYVLSNIIHEFGIYTKQTAGVLTAVVRSAVISGNMMFNSPRACININDEFYGDLEISHNLLFNGVRETSDHSALNSWHRQVYVQVGPADSPFNPSVIPIPISVHHNFILSDYRSSFGLDNDDGSEYFDDHHNLYVFAPKKNYLGHDKKSHNNMYFFPDQDSLTFSGEPRASRRRGKYTSGVDFPENGGTYALFLQSKLFRIRVFTNMWPEAYFATGCFDDYSMTSGWAGMGEAYHNNTCVLQNSPAAYSLGGCQVGSSVMPITFANTFYTNVPLVIPCNVNGNNTNLNLAQFQYYGYDIGSQELPVPSLEDLIDMARNLLMPSN